jgi:hypothetical protein
MVVDMRRSSSHSLVRGRRRCPGPIVDKSDASGHPSNRRFSNASAAFKFDPSCADKSGVTFLRPVGDLA